MKKYIVIPLVLIAALLVGSPAFGQATKLKLANQAYQQFNYREAAERFEPILLSDTDIDIENFRRLANSFRLLRDYPKAEEWYLKTVDHPQSDKVIAEDYYHLARVMMAQEKYEDSQPYIDKYIALSDDKRAEQYKNFSARTIAEWKKNQTQYTVQKSAVNSELDDFSPTFYGNQIVFASNRDKGVLIRRRYVWDGRPFLNLYAASHSNGAISENAEPFFEDVNGRFHEGPVAFSKDLKTIFITRNNYGRGKKALSDDRTRTLGIAMAINQGEDWSEPEMLPFIDQNYNYQHVAVLNNGKTILFSSDMPGGQGGFDLWEATLGDDGKWSTPKNLGAPINTVGNEGFPFYHPNGMLYFASDGHPGIGGLDQFRVKWEGSAQSPVENLGFPVNSPKDDFGIIWKDDFSVGYFSSNRENEDGTDDIYEFEYRPEILIDIYVLDKTDNRPIVLADVDISINDKSERVKTDDQGATEYFEVTNKDNITYVASSEGYKTARGGMEISFDGVSFRLSDTLYLERTEEWVDPDNPIVEGELLDLPYILFDRDKYNIKPQADPILDSVVALMNQYPEMIILCESHTDCRHTAKYNLQLSDNRAKSTREALIKRGIDPERIQAKGYGEERLKNDCDCEAETNIDQIGLREFRKLEDRQVDDCTEEDHQINRRTEFRVIKME